jgi:hypothetical protein
VASPAFQPARLIRSLHGMSPAPPRRAAELDEAPGKEPRGWEEPGERANGTRCEGPCKQRGVVRSTSRGALRTASGAFPDSGIPAGSRRDRVLLSSRRPLHLLPLRSRIHGKR